MIILLVVINDQGENGNQSQEIVILALSCGCGRLELPLKRLNYRNLRGIDISDGHVRLAGELGLTRVVRDDPLSFVQGILEGEVDVVFAFDVLEHIPKESLIDLVRLGGVGTEPLFSEVVRS
jgi:2-polyprenyl-3-methyl-5-hydroxy-6-metoxy-1,4-benzoquinol methylase